MGSLVRSLSEHITCIGDLGLINMHLTNSVQEQQMAALQHPPPSPQARKVCETVAGMQNLKLTLHITSNQCLQNAYSIQLKPVKLSHRHCVFTTCKLLQYGILQKFCSSLLVMSAPL